MLFALGAGKIFRVPRIPIITGLEVELMKIYNWSMSILHVAV